MKIGNNNNVSFGAYEVRLQPGMKPLKNTFRTGLARLEARYASDGKVRITVYDVFSPQAGSRDARLTHGKKPLGQKRLIGASVIPSTGYVIPGFRHTDFMIRTPANGAGAKFLAQLRSFAKSVSDKAVRRLSISKHDSNVGSFGEVVTRPSEEVRLLAQANRSAWGW